MFRYSSSINVLSKSKTVEQISEILNMKSDDQKKNRKNELIDTTKKNEDNVWVLKSSTDPSLPIENQIEDLFLKIKNNKKNFRLLYNDCKVKCSCIIEGDKGNEEDYNPEIGFPPNLIKDLSDINADLEIELFLS
jgi:Domain of unknown function (DUF4279)